MKIRLTEEIWKEGNMYVSYCPELDVASCGEDVQQAKIFEKAGCMYTRTKGDHLIYLELLMKV